MISTLRRRRNLSVAITFGETGDACLVIDDREPSFHGIGFPVGDEWPELVAVLGTVIGNETSARMRLMVAAERPVLQTRFLRLSRVTNSSARLLMERSSDAFFPSAGNGPIAAGIGRVNRHALVAAIIQADIVSAAERAARTTGVQFAGVVPAGSAAAAGAISRAPWLRRGRWRLLIIMSSCVELVEIDRGRTVFLRSSPFISATGNDVGAVVRAARALIADAASDTPVCLVGSRMAVSAVRADLAQVGIPLADQEIADFDGCALSSYGVSAGKLSVPVIMTNAQRAEMKRRRFLSTLLVAGLSTLLVSLASAGYRSALQRRLHQLETDRAAIHADVVRATRTQREVAALTARAEAVERLREDRVSMISLLSRTTEALPDDSHLASFKAEGHSLRLEGWTPSATGLLPLFEAQAWVDSIRMSPASRRERTVTGPRTRFSLALGFNTHGVR